MQPALLYLVPGCLGSAVGMSFLRGEFELLTHYTENSPPPEDEKKTNNNNTTPILSTSRQDDEPATSTVDTASKDKNE